VKIFSAFKKSFPNGKRRPRVTGVECDSCTFSRTFSSSRGAKLLHCFKQVASSNLFQPNIIMDNDLIAKSGVEQTRHIAPVMVHRKCS